MRSLDRIFYILALWLVFLGTTFSQRPNDHNQSGDIIAQLKDGILIVRLDMKENVRKAYSEMIENSSLENAHDKRIKKKLDSLTEQRKRYKENVYLALKEHYHFSEFCLLENHRVNDFLNGDYNVLECEDPPSIDKANVFFLIKGQRDSHWIITDHDFQPLAAPFPSSHDLGVKKFVDFLFGKNNFSKENMEKVFSKMNERLNQYYSADK